MASLNENRANISFGNIEDALTVNANGQNQEDDSATRKVLPAQSEPQRDEAQSVQAEMDAHLSERQAKSEAVQLEIGERSVVPYVIIEEVQRAKVVGSPLLTSALPKVRPILIHLPARQELNNDINYQCLLCKRNARNAVITICGHFYCWRCLWVFERTRRCHTCCPHCRRPLQMHEDIVPCFDSADDDEDTDVASGTNMEGGGIVMRPSAFRINTTFKGCPWLCSDSSCKYSAARRRNIYHAVRPFRSTPILQRSYKFLLAAQIFLMFLLFLVWMLL